MNWFFRKKWMYRKEVQTTQNKNHSEEKEVNRYRPPPPSERILLYFCVSQESLNIHLKKFLTFKDIVVRFKIQGNYWIFYISQKEFNILRYCCTSVFPGQVSTFKKTLVSSVYLKKFLTFKDTVVLLYFSSKFQHSKNYWIFCISQKGFNI